MQQLTHEPPWWSAIHAFLRGGGHRGLEWRHLPASAPFLLIVLCGGAYGAVMSSYHGLIDYQLSIALQLLALAPVTGFANVIYGDYRIAQAWSTLLFAIASWNARRSLDACYAPLQQRNPVHALLRRFWFGLYAFVGIQMGWDLRPFVGHPTMPVQFFREDIGNAYIEVIGILKLFIHENLF